LKHRQWKENLELDDGGLNRLLEFSFSLILGPEEDERKLNPEPRKIDSEAISAESLF